MRKNSLRILVAVILGTCFIACARRLPKSGAATVPAQPAAATSAPAGDGKSKDAPGGKFMHAPSRIELSWPAGWVQTQKEGYEWTIVPAGAPGGAERWISLDVPSLPFHPPGMIPIGQVESGYLDDLKKQYGKLDVKELTPPKLPDAKLRMVRVAWEKDGPGMQQTALLIVHDDHVYIIRERSDVEHEQSTRETFDSVTSSIHWVGKK